MKPTAESFAGRIAEWACQPNLNTHPGSREAARISIVDTLACMVVGTSEQQAVSAMNAMRFGNGAGNVQPVGGGIGLSLLGAAMVNGTRAHAIDFDDHEFPGSTHPSAPILGALFSLARVQPLTIDQMCDAWITGYETICWTGVALGFEHYDRGWHSTSTLGPIGTAAAVSRALGLKAEQTANAMALAASFSAGLKAQFGTDAKALHAGFAAKNGLSAALLAHGNATANIHLWDARHGFAYLYGTADSISFREMMKTMTLGEAVQRFPVARKLWPSCSYTHRTIFGAEQLYHKISANDDITGIRVRMPEPFHRVSCFRIPKNDAEARFSVNYCTAVGLTTGHVTPEDFRPHRFLDPVRQKLAELVELDLYDLPPDYCGNFDSTTSESITVTLKSGQVLETETTTMPGGADLPITHEQLMQKVADCECSVDIAEMFLAADGTLPISETGLLDQEDSTRRFYS